MKTINTMDKTFDIASITLLTICLFVTVWSFIALGKSLTKTDSQEDDDAMVIANEWMDHAMYFSATHDAIFYMDRNQTTPFVAVPVYSQSGNFNGKVSIVYTN